MRITSVQQTPFLRRTSTGFAQVCRVTIENDREAASCTISARAGHALYGETSVHVPPGESTHNFMLSEPSAPGSVEFVVQTSGGLVAARNVDWRPVRRWRVHVVQTSHHDVGYTDLASRVIPQHIEFLDNAIDMAMATRELDDDARSRIVIEVAWSALEFLRKSRPERRDLLLNLLRSGQFELGALFGNMITEFCGHETLIRTLYPAFRLKREYGIPLISAEHNDIDGISWGLCRVLTNAGIRFFCPGLPLYYTWSGENLPSFWDEQAVFGRSGPGAFWWESPTGKRILFWCNNSGCGGDARHTLPNLERRLSELGEQDYPYSILRWPVQGAARDNSPYIEGFCHTIREWNERWAFPHLISSTDARFFNEIQAELPSDLPVHRGDLPGQDYIVGVMSTAYPTTIARNNHMRLTAAETLATVSSIRTDLRYPRQTLDSAHEETLWYDEHTWGYHFPAHGAAVLASQYEKAVHAYRAAAFAHDAASKALARIADRVKVDGDGLHVVVFNTMGMPRTEMVNIPLRENDPVGSEIIPVPPQEDPQHVGYLRGVPLTDRWPAHPDEDIIAGKFDLVDVASGERVSFEIIEIVSANDTVPNAAERLGISSGGKRYGFFEKPSGLSRDLRFLARDVPAVGYRTYRFVHRQDCAPDVFVHREDARPACVIENDFYRVEMGSSGLHIKDKELDWKLVDNSAAHRFADLAVWSPTSRELQVSSRSGEINVLQGPLSTSLTWEGKAQGHPSVRWTITLHEHAKRIDLSVQILKNPEPLLDVHLAFPFALESPQFRYESALGVITPFQDFLPGSQSDRLAVQNWVCIAGGDRSILWSSQDSPAVSLGDLWPGYVSPAHQCVRGDDSRHHTLTSDDLRHAWIYSTLFSNNFQTNFSVSQTGFVLFRYAISSRMGCVPDTEAAAFGWETTTPFATSFTQHRRNRTLPPVDGFLHIEPRSVLLSALKRAEDGRGLILRLWNMDTASVKARVTLPHLSLKRVTRTNIVEEDEGPVETCDPHTFTLELAPQEIVTCRVETSH